MKSHEFTLADQINEDWKNWVSAASLATMAGTGASVAYDKLHDRPPVQQQDASSQIVAQPKHKHPAPASRFHKVSTETVEKAKKVMSMQQAKLLARIGLKNGLKRIELAQFLAQCAHETAGFSTLVEFGGRKDFEKYDIAHNKAKATELGNIHPGDGVRFKGRGFIQLTGRDKYRRVGEALGIPLEQKPELAETPEVAAEIAVWYWKTIVRPRVHDFRNTAEATKPINAGLLGLQDRHDLFMGILHLLDG